MPSPLHLIWWGGTGHVQALPSLRSQRNWRITWQCDLEGLYLGKYNWIGCPSYLNSHPLSLISDSRCQLKEGAYRFWLISYLPWFISYGLWVFPFLFWGFSDVPKASNCPLPGISALPRSAELVVSKGLPSNVGSGGLWINIFLHWFLGGKFWATSISCLESPQNHQIQVAYSSDLNKMHPHMVFLPSFTLPCSSLLISGVTSQINCLYTSPCLRFYFWRKCKLI